ncbi:hypothetical protein D3C71_1844730 [compost metagenome]
MIIARIQFDPDGLLLTQRFLQRFKLAIQMQGQRIDPHTCKQVARKLTAQIQQHRIPCRSVGKPTCHRFSNAHPYTGNHTGTPELFNQSFFGVIDMG